MTTFVFTELVNAPMADIVSSALGANAGAKFSANDVGKLVKLGSANNYVLAADGDQIEGFVVAMMDNTVNDGFSFGSVQKNKRKYAKVGGTVALAVGDRVVAGVQAALGTVDALPVVKAGTPAVHIWRVIRIVTGTGAVGDTVLIERV
jgi:hypothetical protein